MTTIVYALILLLITLGSKGGRLLSPETTEDVVGDVAPPVSCRAETASERAERGGGGLGKVSQFTLDGEYHCERAVFDYGERWPFIDLVMESVHGEARRIGQRAAALVAAEPRLKGQLWAVSVVAPDSDIASQITPVFQNALVETLGPDVVVRAPRSSDSLVQVQITVRPVADPSLLFVASAALRRAVASDDGSGFRGAKWPL